MEHAPGVAGFVGARADRRWWFAEATVGLGLEAVRLGRVEDDHDRRVEDSGVDALSGVRPCPYLRGVGGLGVRVTGSLDLMARASLHTIGHRSGDFVAATLGVRVRLP